MKISVSPQIVIVDKDRFLGQIRATLRQSDIEAKKALYLRNERQDLVPYTYSPYYAS